MAKKRLFKYTEEYRDHQRLVSHFNRLGNCKNPYQTPVKKVLCVCSAGLLRSPTAAVVLSQEPFNFNTRAAGITSEFALIKVDDVLLTWADEVVCMDHIQRSELERQLKALGMDTPVLVLNMPDQFRYRDPALMRLIAEAYTLELERINGGGRNTYKVPSGDGDLPLVSPGTDGEPA